MSSAFPWGAFLAFAITSSVTPGPNVIMLTGSGSTWGYLKTLPHLLGVCFGFPLMLLVVQFGAGVVFEHVPWVFSILTIFSLIYAIWLSVRIFDMGFKKEGEARTRARPMTFLEASAFQWINAKAWQMVIMVATLFQTQEVDIKIYCAVSFIGVLFVCGTFWVELGKRITRFLATPRIRIAYYSVLALSLFLSTVPTGLLQLWELRQSLGW